MMVAVEETFNNFLWFSFIIIRQNVGMTTNAMFNNIEPDLTRLPSKAKAQIWQVDKEAILAYR